MIRTIAKLSVLTAILLLQAARLEAQDKMWTGSWSCAPYAAGQGNTPPAPYLENNTLRQVVRVSIGGDTLRMKFSNKTSATAVTMNKVSLAVSAGNSAIDTATLAVLRFAGDTSVTMDPYASVMSDPLAFPLDADARLAISIHYGQAGSDEDVTSHVASRTDSYIVTGGQTDAGDFGNATITAHWFHINTIDVLAPDTSGCVGILGNSITDGYGLSGGLQNRWTDFFSQSLLDDQRTSQVGVLNLGIGATSVSGGSPTSGVSRFQDDILSQSGLRWLIIFYGVNDIGWGASASTVISAYQEMIDQAHARNIKVYGATITPFKGHSYYTEAHEEVRGQVNAWIRTPGNFDAFIDFDRAIRDSQDTARMAAIYSRDWLHPSVEGYEFLGNYVDLDLFTEAENSQQLFAYAGPDQSFIDLNNTGSYTVRLDASASSAFGTDITSYIWSEGGEVLATGATALVDLATGRHLISLEISDDEGNSDSDELVVNIVEDSGIWLEAECAEVGSLWETIRDEDASGGYYVTVEAGSNSTGGAYPGAEGLLSFSFEVKEPGTYNLAARTICPNANDDSFWLKMDDGSYAMWNNIAASGTWNWDYFGSGYSLGAGMHTLSISFREDGARLDKLWLNREGATLENAGSDAGNCDFEILQADAGEDAIICLPADAMKIGGDPVVSGGAGPFTYAWSCLHPPELSADDLLDDPAIANPNIVNIPELNDTIFLTLTVQDRFSDRMSDTLRIVLSSLGITTDDLNQVEIMRGDSVALEALNIYNGIPPLSFRWDPVYGLDAADLQGPVAKPDSSVVYVAAVLDAAGCTASDTVRVLVSLPSWIGLNEIKGLETRVYPNPVGATSGIYISWPDFIDARIRIFDHAGRLIIEDAFVANAFPLAGTPLAPGVYYYQAMEKDLVLDSGKFIMP